MQGRNSLNIFMLQRYRSTKLSWWWSLGHRRTTFITIVFPNIDLARIIYKYNVFSVSTGYCYFPNLFLKIFYLNFDPIIGWQFSPPRFFVAACLRQNLETPRQQFVCWPPLVVAENRQGLILNWDAWDKEEVQRRHRRRQPVINYASMLI